jgi:hypothetical protein
MRIAMWSGPRNLSTAMMYSFGARADCAVWDEPFYAAYLAHSDATHPMQAEILAAGIADPVEVARRCSTGPIPEGKRVFYQKHMAHHMLPAFPRDWMKSLTHVFLIRHPARVIASYHVKAENPSLRDIGAVELTELFDAVKDLAGRTPVVIDSADIRQDPEAMLHALCAAIGLPFDPAMLSWPKGGHKDDGVWAPHWYNAVWQSTGFAGAEGPLPEVSAHLRPVLGAALPYYEKLAACKLAHPGG